MKRKDQMKQYVHMLVTCTFLAMLAGGCSSNTYEVKGTLQGLEEGDSVLVFVDRGIDSLGNSLPIDTLSTRVKDGVFLFKGTVDKPQYARLGFHTSRQSLGLFIEHGRIEISGHKDSLEQAMAIGTPNNDLLYAHQKQEERIYAEISPILHRLRDSTVKSEEEKVKLNQHVNHLRDSLQMLRRNLVVNHSTTYVAPIYLRLLQDRIPLDSLTYLFDRLAKDVQASPTGVEIANRIEGMKRTAIGMIAPDFEAPDHEGNLVKLSDYRGKYVLVDFWASWCVPCRHEHPHLVEVYGKYRDKGFTIIGVSLDNKREPWVEAIAADGLIWPNVSMLQGFGDPLAKLYGVQPIPDNFLIDPEGKIIARRIRGEQVTQTIAELVH